MDVEGRSYIVGAGAADLARAAARIKAAREGHRNAKGATILHVERIEDRLYEVVIQSSQPRQEVER